MAIYLDEFVPERRLDPPDDQTGSHCAQCQTEVSSLERARDGRWLCEFCAKAPWEHALAGMHGDAQFLAEQILGLPPSEARALAKALTGLERELAELANQAAQRMEQE